MALEPDEKRAVIFVDGQNLYHCAKEAFGYSWPNYDLKKLANFVCAANGWSLKQVRFYTGYPSRRDDQRWAAFWQKKLLSVSRQGVHKFTRELKYRDKIIILDSGEQATLNVGEEKGIDVRIAIDIIRLGLNNDYDVAVIFSQDQDLSEATDEVKSISRQQNRWIKIACAFPIGRGTVNGRGINGTEWIKIFKAPRCFMWVGLFGVSRRPGR